MSEHQGYDPERWRAASQILHGAERRCAVHEPDGSVCGEPVLIGAVCYDHAKTGPRGEPFCPITGEHGEASSDYDWQDPSLDREQEQML